MMTEEITLKRDCPATLIPAGDRITLREGTRVWVSQALGGSVTVRAEGGLFRLDPEDVDALGEEAASQLGEPEAGQPAARDGEFGEEQVWEVLKTCFDPEIPINIVDLGLIYDLNLQSAEGGGYRVEVKMTLTAQGCGMGPVIAQDARTKIQSLPEVTDAQVDIVWEPVWNPQMISSEGRKKLGLE